MEDETEHQTLVNKLSHSERLASIGRFAAGVAHEVGNPVTGIACLAQNLKLETDSEPVLETGEQILTQTKRITRIVQSLVRFAHTGQGEEQEDHLPLNLHELIGEAIHLVSLDTRSKQISFMNETPVGMQISGDPQRLLQVFVNLLNNASDASEEQDEICIEADYEEGSVVIRVTDQGSGISPEHQAKIFEPFLPPKILIKAPVLDYLWSITSSLSIMVVLISLAPPTTSRIKAHRWLSPYLFLPRTAAYSVMQELKRQAKR
ncbi:HAMP domain-containing sensor histidine kinase [Aliamphritea spongicola]|nr:HAMP domain-containing sensor histidine kinase [Aliamphritea spongicola]